MTNPDPVQSGNRKPPATVARWFLAVIACLFGVVTIVAGSRVLLGSNPGFVVFRPLLVYNTLMGLAYIAVGVIIGRNLAWGRYGSGAIASLNLLVLLGISLIFLSGGAVAVESLRAMTLRTVVWLVLFAALVWLGRNQPPPLIDKATS